MLTFRRPDGLRAALPPLLEQAVEVEPAGYRVELLVVDNDPQASGRPVIEAFGSPRIRYVVEPTPGIAAARNRVLDEAADSAFLVFIDDDEQPHPGWLAALLDTQARTGAAAVVGAVVCELPQPLDPWVEAGRFFRRPRLSTGTPVDVAATNNLLLDMAAIRATGLRFDAAFGLTGGSDSLFTRQLHLSGHGLVWCDEAVVTDSVPASRMSRDWVLRRAFRFGNATSRMDLVLADGRVERVAARLRAVARGVPRLVGGSLRWLVGTVARRPYHQARGLWTVARGAGFLVGGFGIVYVEYGRGKSATGTVTAGAA
jgi:glycosyltransferase involved in cell wall biosynthesis